jgi:O-acetyl-ADP-ribose deacetylase (regulator of RNase III)
LVECRSQSGCATGKAKITKGYNLPAKYIIHTVSPVYAKVNGKKAQLLSNCYKNSLLLAEKYNCRSIAVPVHLYWSLWISQKRSSKNCTQNNNQFFD